MGDRKTFIMLMGFVLLTLLVVGCSQATLPEETSVPRETLLPSETATIIPTHTPNYHPSTTPRPTMTPFPNHEYKEGTSNSLFPVPNQIPVQEMPTPISTTSLTENQFKLKDWSSEEAIGLIQIADQYSYDGDFRLTDSDSYYYDLQYSVDLIIQEALIRYPDLILNEDIQWKNLLVDLDNDYGNGLDPTQLEWLRSQIEEALNSPTYSLSSINEFLHPRG